MAHSKWVYKIEGNTTKFGDGDFTGPPLQSKLKRLQCTSVCSDFKFK